VISVVVPTLNAENGLVRALSSLLEAAMRGLVRDVVVADGGSTDLTLEIAEDAGCTIVHAGTSTRGGLMDAGARAAGRCRSARLHRAWATAGAQSNIEPSRSLRRPGRLILKAWPAIQDSSP
jgi:hypothetical protein